MDASAVIGIVSAVGNGLNQAEANRIKASGTATATVEANNGAMEAMMAQIQGGTSE